MFTTEQAIKISKENLKLCDHKELREMIVETAFLYPPLEAWMTEFKSDKNMINRFKNEEYKRKRND